MTERVFVDTNVLVYGRDASEKEKQPKAREWIDHLWRTRSGRLSIQVLHEFYVTITEKLNAKIAKSTAREDIRNLMAWHPVLLDGKLLESAWNVQDKHKVSWWDSLIVAAAHAAHCHYLLSEDFQDGRMYDNLQVVNPFLHDLKRISQEPRRS